MVGRSKGLTFANFIMMTLTETFMYLLLVVVMVLLFVWLYIWIKTIWNIIRGYAVPNVTTPSRLIQALKEHCMLGGWDVFVDLGCGEGEVLYQMSLAYPDASYVWIEANSYPYNKALKRHASTWVTLLQEDFFDTDLSKATHVYCYLMPHLMSKVRLHLSKMCASWTYVYVNAFPIPDTNPLEVVELGTSWKFSRTLYIYKITD